MEDLLLVLGAIAGIFAIVVGSSLAFIAGINFLDRLDEKKGEEDE